MYPGWIRFRFAIFAAVVFTTPGLHAAQAETQPTWTDAQSVLKAYCRACHLGTTAPGGFNLEKYTTPDSIVTGPDVWGKVIHLVRNAEMPPKGMRSPSPQQREQLAGWVEKTLRTAICSAGPKPVSAPLRRLNRAEYSATMRDLLNIHINAGHALPADGAGGEGFDNAAETLFLSPIHAEKYLEAARAALSYGARDPRSRAVFLIAEPGVGFSPEQAARKVLAHFLPRAFRRPATPAEIQRYYRLYELARQRGENWEDGILFALEGVLISPHFLFRIPAESNSAEPAPVSDYELASRLSYFLWATMPDEPLFQLAAQGRLNTPEVLRQQVSRMLADTRSRDFAEQFVEQWLGTRELGRDIKPDIKLFPTYYDAETQAAIRYEPVLFFQEILAENLSLLNLLDSRFTFLTNRLQRHYGLELPQKADQQPRRVELPEGSRRGGLLTMAAVLAVSSYPHRTSPVLRGKWIMEAILGTPPPPPPPNVPQLKEDTDAATPQTLREKLTMHRQNPTCASCHNRIDPLGFGLENFDVVGRWRSQDAGQPIDARGELPDGATFNGPEELKKVLLDRKDLFLRNLTSKMLGYALGRALTLEDSCTVDQIAAQVKASDYSARTLVEEIVLSAPFRYQAARPAKFIQNPLQTARKENPQ